MGEGPLADQYRRYELAWRDSALVRRLARRLLKSGLYDQDRFRHQRIETERNGLQTALVVAYGRPFTRTRSDPCLPAGALKVLSPELTETHAYLLEARHKVYAHSEIDLYPIELSIRDGRVVSDYEQPREI